MGKKKVSIKTKKGSKKGKKTKSPKQDKGLQLAHLPEEMLERAQVIWMAGLGALSTAQDEGGKAFKELVKKGESWEKKRAKDLGAAKEKFDAALEGLTDRGKAAGGEVSKRLNSLEETLEALLGRINSAVKEEVKEVSGRVEALSKRIEVLAEDVKAGASVREAMARTVVSVVSNPEGGWMVEESGSDEPVSYPNKKTAVAEARTRAQSLSPSQLVIYKMDGTVQDTQTYG